MAKINIYGLDKTTPLKVVETEWPENENNQDGKESREHKAIRTALMLGILEKISDYNNRFA